MKALKKIGKMALYVVLALVVMAAVFWLIAPYEDADLAADFDASVLDSGVANYLAARESAFDDITPGTEKQVIWAGAPEVATEWAVLYLHGFSASAQEIRPVPDDVAGGLGANLVFTRLAGHGRGGDAMAEGSVGAWTADVAEALAVARKLGRRLLVIGTSTGGTLATAAVMDANLAQGVAGVVLVSPNYGIRNPLAPMLTWPAARYWLPVLAGQRRSFQPINEAHARYWTTEFSSVAVMPMAALVARVRGLNVAQAGVPALFVFSDADRVVDAGRTRAIAGRWGAPVRITEPHLTPADDPSAHVIAGDILSPSTNAAITQAIPDFAREL